MLPCCHSPRRLGIQPRVLQDQRRRKQVKKAALYHFHLRAKRGECAAEGDVGGVVQVFRRRYISRTNEKIEEVGHQKEKPAELAKASSNWLRSLVFLGIRHLGVGSGVRLLIGVLSAGLLLHAGIVWRSSLLDLRYRLVGRLDLRHHVAQSNRLLNLLLLVVRILDRQAGSCAGCHGGSSARASTSRAVARHFRQNAGVRILVIAGTARPIAASGRVRLLVRLLGHLLIVILGG